MALFGLFKKNKDKKVDNKKSSPVVSDKNEVAVNAPASENKKANTVVEAPKPTEMVKPEIKTAVKSDVKTAPKKESAVSEKEAPKKETEAKTTVKATPKAEVKSAPKAETKTTAKSEAKKDTISKNESKKAAESQTNPAKHNTKVVETAEDGGPAEEAIETKTAEVAKGYTGKFEINKSKDGKKYFFNLYASNKVGIATSQMYSTAQSALNGIKSVIANAPKAPIEDQSLKTYETLPFPKWEIYIDNGGKYRFRLNASNGNCVCHSQGYTTKNACKNGIDSIIRSSRNAEIDKTYIQKKD